MAERTLSNYCDEAKELIRADSYDQAIAICRHMLRHYPKYVRAYRLMGEACLEKGDYVEAANLFKRVLGADMEDMVVRVGLGIAFDQQGALDEAIWQLERAFELSPGNSEIRAELQRLYGERDGATPAKLKLTPAALGRLYLREELYQRAIDEFESVLAEDPERADVQVALAQALWWTEQRQDAANVCEELLEQYPHCLKANLILGEIFLSTERDVEAQNLLETAQALDPENLVAQSLFRDKSPLSPERMIVPALEQEELEQELVEFGAIEPSADSEIEEVPEGFVTGSQESDEEAMPDWLRQLREEEQEFAAEEDGSAPEAQEMPEWLRQLADERATETAEQTEASARVAETDDDNELSSWLSELAGETAGDRGSASPEGSEEPSEEAPLGEEYIVSSEASGPSQEAEEMVPEWSGGEDEADEEMRPEDESAEWVPEPGIEPSTEGPGPPAAESPEEIPDWIRDLPPEPKDERPTAWAEEAAEEAIADASQRAEPDLGEDYPAGAEAQISPDTMDRLRETMPDESASIEEIMAWMERSKALLEEDGIPGISPEERAEVVVSDAGDVAEPVDESELPPWLQEMRPPIGDRGEEAAEPVAEEDLPPWLRELKPEAEVPGVAVPEEREGGPDQAVESSEEVPVVAEEEAPPEAELSPEELEARSWLLQLREEALEEAGMPEADRRQEIPEARGEEEMPSWLLDLRQEPVGETRLSPPEDREPALEEPAGIEEGEEIPSWLHELRAEEAPDLHGPREDELEPQDLAEPEPHVIEAELPPWLRELRAEMAEEGEMPPPEDVRVALEAEPTEPAKEEIPSLAGELGDEGELGVPLQPEEVETPVTEVEAYGPEQEDVPSWLRELRAQAEKGETEPLLEKAEEAADEVEFAPLEEEELPSWLRELKAEAAKEDIAPAPTPEEEITEEVFVEEVFVSEEQEQLVAEEVVPPAVTEEERVAPVAFTEAEEEAPPPEEERPAEARPEPGWGVEEYREYLQRSPRDHEARLTLARVYAESGDLDRAVKHYGELLSYASMTEEVLKDLETAATSAPDHLATHELLADAYMRAGELKKALDKYRWLRTMITQ